MRFQSTLRFPQLMPTTLRTPAMSVGKNTTESRPATAPTELQQLLEITSELGTLGDLDEFLQKFVVRAADFLAFQRAAIALADRGNCTVRWIGQNGTAKPIH